MSALTPDRFFDLVVPSCKSVKSQSNFSVNSIWDQKMKFGICLANYGETLSVDSLRKVALGAEEFGYDSIWTTDHVLMPASSGTPYERIFDSIATLCYLAPLTNKVKLGISSLIIAMRNPIVVAKQLASLDHFNNGRTILAIGTGWNEKEFSFVGSDFHARGKRVDESIEIIRALWRGESKFSGKDFSFENAVFEPTPIQKDLEIWIAGASRAAMKRVARLGDAWHPNVMPLENFRKTVSEFRKIVGNKNIRVRIGLNLRSRESEITGTQGEKRLIFSGDMKQNEDIIAALSELGVDYCVLSPNSNGKIGAEEQIQAMRQFADVYFRR
jgi:probable F420-dependent oxidoreductase